MSGLTLNNSVYNQILSLRETLLGRETIEAVINGTNIHNLLTPTGELTELEMNLWTSRIASRFRIAPESTTLFSLSFTDQNPIIAHGVVQGFLDAVTSLKDAMTAADS